MIGDAYKAAEQRRRALLNAGARYWLNDNDDLRTAPHEAGHTLVGFLLDLDPTHTTIDGGHGFAGRTIFGVRTTDDRAFDRAVALMAGSEAEAMFGFAADDRARTDLKLARALLSRSSDDDTISDARRRARRLLKANRGALVAITVALLAKRTLDADEIAEIMHANDDDNDDAEQGEMLVRMPDRAGVQYRLGSIL